MNEIEQVLTRLHLGIHSGDGSGINRLHWISFVDFIINNPADSKKSFTHKLISVMCVRERTALEYINAAVAWNVLIVSGGEIRYNRTYRTKVQRKKEKKELKMTMERTDDEILKNRR